jgi:hypothetical protein
LISAPSRRRLHRRIVDSPAAAQGADAIGAIGNVDRLSNGITLVISVDEPIDDRR